MRIFSAVGILCGNLLPHSIYLSEKLRMMCKLNFRWLSRQFPALLFGAEAGGFTHQVHADLLEAPASALGSAAKSPGRHNCIPAQSWPSPDPRLQLEIQASERRVFNSTQLRLSLQSGPRRAWTYEEITIKSRNERIRSATHDKRLVKSTFSFQKKNVLLPEQSLQRKRKTKDGSK